MSMRMCLGGCAVHTLWAGRLLALSHQQAGGLGVRGAISRVVRTHYHPDERGSASREITLQQSGGNNSITLPHVGKRFHLTSAVCSRYLQLVLRVYVPYGRVGVEGGVRVVPAHHAVAQGGEHVTGLRLRDWVHLTLHACAYTVARLGPTDLHSEMLAQHIDFSTLSNMIKKNNNKKKHLGLFFYLIYLKDFIFFIKSSSEQANDFTPWHMGVLTITSYQIF